MCVVRSVYSSVLQRKVEDEQRNLGGLEEHFQQVKRTIIRNNNYYSVAISTLCRLFGSMSR
jgi:hypothetical protein